MTPVPVVAFRSVDARAVRLRLQLGRRCRAQLADALDDGVFESHEAQRTGCRLRPFRGPLTIRASGPGGSVTRALEVPRDGRVVVSFSALGEMFASPGLTAFERLDFGVARGISGWAGRIDVVKLRAAWADRHARAIAAGRGAPGYFAVLYPDHPAVAQARAMALQERMRRQLDDYAAVAEGQRSAFDFLLRHVWSPFRRSVESVVAGGTLPPVTLEGADAAPPQ